MMKRISTIAACLALSTISVLAPLSNGVFAFNPNYLVSDSEMTDTLAIDKAFLEEFLERGYLAEYETEDVNDVVRPAADIIWNAAMEFNLNPQFLLVLLQREQSLVEDDDPTQDQLDWAMGYAVCDDCSKDDPIIQKFKGFGNQVYYAAKRIRESYLVDLDTRGYTVSGVGPGIETEIDGISVIPTNAATSVLYTYTPHLHGNENFVIIWQRWFTRDYPTGSLLQNSEDGGVWLIQYGKRRPITSRTALLTRFNESAIIPVKPSVLDAYPLGNPISLPNYSLLRSPRGTVYLLVDDTLRGFDSQEAFRSLGFNSEEIIDVTFEDLAPYSEGEPITVASSDPQGSLLQNSTTGGVYYVEEDVKYPIMSAELLKTRFGTRTIIPTDPVVLDVYETGEPVGFTDGTLVAVNGSPDVFVISEGMRRPIINGETFETFGWKWENVIWTNERAVLVHPLGEFITMPEPLDTEDPDVETALSASF